MVAGAAHLKALPFLYRFFTEIVFVTVKRDTKVSFPVMNLGVVFIIREFSDGRRELEWADGVLGLTETARWVNLLN